MAHEIHKTRAFVLSARNTRREDRRYVLLTERFGTLVARAQSVRKEKSKLRYTLQPYALVEIFLVRGRGGWRVTTATLEKNLFFDTESTEKRRLLASLFSLVERLAFEEESENIFDDVEKIVEELAEIAESDIAWFELYAVGAILERLGYGVPTLHALQGDIEGIIEHRRKIIREINEAISLSGL